MDDKRDPGDLAHRQEAQRRAERGRGAKEETNAEPRESAPHGTVTEEPQRKSGSTVGYPAR